MPRHPHRKIIYGVVTSQDVWFSLFCLMWTPPTTIGFGSSAIRRPMCEHYYSTVANTTRNLPIEYYRETLFRLYCSISSVYIPSNDRWVLMQRTLCASTVANCNGRGSRSITILFSKRVLNYKTIMNVVHALTLYLSNNYSWCGNRKPIDYSNQKVKCEHPIQFGILSSGGSMLFRKE